MRTLKRNKQKVWYVNLTGNEEILREGIRTGEFRKTYSEPSLLMANVSPASGNTSIEPFGVETNYTHILAIEGTDSPITETSILCVGDRSESDEFYMVTKIAKSLNHIRYALKEIESDMHDIFNPNAEGVDEDG